MPYFKGVSLIFGSLMMFATCAAFFRPSAYKDFVLQKVYPEKRSPGVIVAAVLFCVLVIFSWREWFAVRTLSALMVCLVLLLSLLKVFLILFYYHPFRGLVFALLTKEIVALRVLSACGFAVGLCLLILGFKM
ncbi:MAG: hypothetical protein PHS88_08355 [Candidatus Omnitrophica bacterium]|nr:hypothetical protein [Candidatus Omnitrophota bacterium]